MRILFLGSASFALPSLKALFESAHELVAVVSQPDRPRGRGGQEAPTPVAKEALRRGISVLRPTRLSAAVMESLRDAPEMLVCVAYGQKVPQDLIDAMPLGSLNVHPSLLPRHRGAAPIPATILAGDQETGVTIIRLVQEMDAGPIVGQMRMNLTGRERCADLEQALSEMGASLLLACIDRICQGHAIWRDQEAGQVTWAPKLTPEMMEMDWTRDAFSLDRQVRALSFSPGARTLCQGGILKVMDSLPSPDPAAPAPPGTLLRVTPPGIWVSAGQGQLCLVLVQPASGKVMDALAFARGRALEAGHRLGPAGPEVSCPKIP